VSVGTRWKGEIPDLETFGGRRYPRVIGPEEVESIPTIPFADGLLSTVIVSRERDDSKYILMGVMHGNPDHADFDWEQGAWDEVLYVLKGNVRVEVRDHADKETVLEGKDGDYFYLAAGFFYSMKSTGVDTEVMWFSAPAPKVGVRIWGETGMDEAPDYAKALRALRTREEA
jgi:uncharacterized RmlC-like cupin family protein